MKSCMRTRVWVNDEFDEEYFLYMHQRCVDEFGVNMVERFFHILIGFHTGILDSVGRFPERYERARTRLAAFVDDLKIVTEGLASDTQLPPRDVAMREKVSNTTDSRALWQEFAKKWQLGLTVDYSFVLCKIENWEKVVEKNPHPRFQVLCLLDLPPEILSHVMLVSDQDQRKSWYMTCKSLQEPASRFVYEVIEYYMGMSLVAKDPADDIPADAEDRHSRICACARQAAFAQRDAIYERMWRATRSEAISRQTRRLTFHESWTSESHTFYPFNYVDYLEIPYYGLFGPLFKRLSKQLLRSPVVEFSYRTRYISEALWVALSGCETLRTLELETIVPADLQWAMAPSVVNLRLRMEHLRYEVNWLWNIACFCPSALFLSFIGHEEHGAPVLPRIIDNNGHNIMTHIRRLDLRRVRAESLTILADAIALAGPAPLTHLSISPIASHIKQDVALALCDSFRQAPYLRVLRIASLQYARPEFLALLGECAPDLTMLVLEFCPSVSLQELPSSPWPRPSFEYALHLAALSHLEHLGLNIPVDRRRVATNALIALERAERPTSGDEIFSDDEADEDDSVGENAAMATARLFAVYGRRLKTIFFDKVEWPHWGSGWAVDRDIDGTPLLRNKLTDRERAQGEEFASYCRDWEFEGKEGEEILRGEV
ncbi:uncharacterized protein SCHCODRAFT_02515700 [Schizophyllum commune H4-8]|nr:uncharacterized protein SCHCODRAFT_02515700 [Schizophyllum commune H4-8]KAI5887257.1 hypothetical protein SCHCODRAFT_02515700 [Schizophyllum commune H4-8]